MSVKLIGKHEKDSRACRDAVALSLKDMMGKDESIVYIDCDLMGCINTKQLVIYQPMMGAVVCEIALAEVADAADVAAVKAIFQARIDAQVAGGAWYPESIRGWQENSRIVTNGNYVMMIAWQFCEDAVADFNALF